MCCLQEASSPGEYKGKWQGDIGIFQVSLIDFEGENDIMITVSGK